MTTEANKGVQEIHEAQLKALQITVDAQGATIGTLTRLKDELLRQYDSVSQDNQDLSLENYAMAKELNQLRTVVEGLDAMTVKDTVMLSKAEFDELQRIAREGITGRY